MKNGNEDPFLCTCNACINFWKINFGKYSPEILQTTPICRTKNTATLLSQRGLLKVGDKVKIGGKYPGIVKYIGSLDDNLIAPEVYVGVHLYDNIGSTHNGLYNGKRYFYCPRGHGAFVPYNQVTLLPSLQKHPPIVGNLMYKGYEDIKRRRRIRSMKDPDFDLGLTRWERESRRPRTASSVSSSTSSLQSVMHTSDPFDIAYQDQLKRQLILERKKKNYMQGKKSENLPQIIPATDKRFNKWKQEFGGDQRAEKMAQTLARLHLAYDRGLELQQGYNDDESVNES